MGEALRQEQVQQDEQQNDIWIVDFTYVDEDSKLVTGSVIVSNSNTPESAVNTWMKSMDYDVKMGDAKDLKGTARQLTEMEKLEMKNGERLYGASRAARKAEGV